jgi:hypothetical protein
MTFASKSTWFHWSEHFARHAPAGEISEQHHRLERVAQMVEDGVEIIGLEESSALVLRVGNRDGRYRRSPPRLVCKAEHAAKHCEFVIHRCAQRGSVESLELIPRDCLGGDRERTHCAERVAKMRQRAIQSSP